MDASTPTYVDAAHVLRRYGFSSTTLWRMQKAGAFVPPRYLPGGQRRWLLADLERWEAQHLQAKDPQP